MKPPAPQPDFALLRDDDVLLASHFERNGIFVGEYDSNSKA